jgi:hypothetical protein
MDPTVFGWTDAWVFLELIRETNFEIQANLDNTPLYCCQVVEKRFCVDLRRQKARIYSPWKGEGGYPPVP